MQPAAQPVSTFDELYRQLRWLPNHLRGEINVSTLKNQAQPKGLRPTHGTTQRVATHPPPQEQPPKGLRPTRTPLKTSAA